MTHRHNDRLNTGTFARFSALLCLSILLQGCQSDGDSLVVEGIKRTYITHASATKSAISDTKAPTDTVMLLHDYNSTGQQFYDTSQIASYLELRQMRVIAPNAFNGRFNNGSNNNTKEEESVNDVAFLDALIAQHHDSEGRIVVLGIGTGASMAARFATQTDYQLHGVGIVAGFMFDTVATDKSLKNSVPPAKTIILYGEADSLAPIGPANIALTDTQQLSIPGMHATTSRWGQWLKCSTSLSAVSYKIISQKNKIGCRNNSQFIELSIKNFGHYWAMPTTAEPPATEKFGPYLNKLNTTELMLNTFLGKVE